jgi:hypothetical protein
MTTVWVRRVGSNLVPYDKDAAEEFEKLPRGKPIKADLKQPRNLEFHRLYWALCSRIGHGIGKDAEWVDWALRVETGHADVFMTTGGREVLRVRSISFAEMDEVAFRTFFNEAVQIVYERWKIDPASVADLLLPRGMT